MGDVLVRKCDRCKEPIEINVHDIHDVALRKGRYYHTSCLLDHATKKVAAKKGIWQTWQEIIDNIDKYEDDANNTLKNYWARDQINNYLISAYDIISPPDRLFEVIAELNNGSYKKRRCNPINNYDLLSAWQWAQHNLDKINKNNKMRGVGPKNDQERILYDLAIVVGKMPVFFERKRQHEADESERQRQLSEAIKIDYSKIGRPNVQTTNTLQDISSLIDDIF